MTLYKGHLGIGVAEPSGQLELAGDERIQEYPPRALTGYETLVEGHGVFKASASTWVSSTYETYFAFDRDNSKWWLSLPAYDANNGSYTGSVTTGNIDGSGTSSGEWLQISLPSKIFLSRSGWITSASSTRGPKTGVILGSNNGSDWNTIHSFSGKTYSGTVETELFSGTSSTAYQYFRIIGNTIEAGARLEARRWSLFGTPGPTTLDKGSLTLGRSLDVPRISRYDVDTETPRPEKLVVDFDTTVNSSPTDISGQGNHGTFGGSASYSAADKAFNFDGANGSNIRLSSTTPFPLNTDPDLSFSVWVKVDVATSTAWRGVWELGNRGASENVGVYIPASSHGVGPNQFNFTLWGSDLITGEAVEANRWYHLAGAYTAATKTRQFYVDGILKGTVTTSTGMFSSLDPANPPLTLGTNSTTSYSEGLAGDISNFKLYNVALEPSEVKKLYNLGRTGRSMVISDTAVGIGKVPEAQLDVRGILKASVGLFPDKPFFACPVASYGLKTFSDPTVVKWYSGSSVLSDYTFTTAQRWLLATVPEENVMYATQNVKLVSIFNDSASETSGVQVPYKGKYLLIHHCRTNNTSSGTTFLIYSRKLNEYIITSANNMIIPFGGNSGTSSQYNGVQTVVHLDEGDIVSFIFTRTPNTTGSYEQFVSLVML